MDCIHCGFHRPVGSGPMRCPQCGKITTSDSHSPPPELAAMDEAIYNRERGVEKRRVDQLKVGDIVERPKEGFMAVDGIVINGNQYDIAFYTKVGDEHFHSSAKLYFFNEVFVKTT